MFDTKRRVKFKALFKKKFLFFSRFNRRSQSAQLVNKTYEELLINDYVKIGTIYVEHLAKHQWRVYLPKVDSGEKTFSHKLDVTSDLLIEAAKKGGDLVTLTADKQFEMKFSHSQGECLNWEEYTVWEHSMATRGKTVSRQVTHWRCNQWASVFNSDEVIYSKGSVWRKEPELITNAQRAEMHDIKTVLAAKEGRLSEVQRLLNQGIDAKIVWTRALDIVVEKGYVDVAKLLIARGADVNAINKNGYNALYLATSALQLEMTQFLIDSGADVNARVGKNEREEPASPLYNAVSNGNLDVIKLLLEGGAKVDGDAKNEFTPLMRACECGYVEVVKVLIGAGANLQATDESDKTALVLAAEGGHVEVVKFLIKAGADVHTINEKGKAALQQIAKQGQVEVAKALNAAEAYVNAINLAVEKGNVGELQKLLDQKEVPHNVYVQALGEAAAKGRVDIVKLLFSRGVDVNAINNEGDTVLHSAARGGHVEMVKFLIAEGLDVNATSKYDGYTALHKAAEGGHVEMVKFLIAEGLDVNATSKYHSYTALHRAAEGGHVEMVKFLIAEGLDVNATSKFYGFTALHEAAREGHVEVVKFLIKAGANVNATSKKGYTALHEAAREGHIEMVKFLIAEGVDVNATSRLGLTALHKAAEGGHVEMVKFLIAEGLDVNATSKYDGFTALHEAAREGHVEVVKFLIKAGANVNATSKKGYTALQKAKERGHVEVVKELQLSLSESNRQNKI